MKINITAPVNQLGYGIAGLNIIKSLVKLGHEVSFWPIGRTEATPEDTSILQQCMKNSQFFYRYAPSIRLYHQNQLAQHVGSGPRIGFPIFELNKFNKVEKHHLLAQDKVLVCSEWAKKVYLENFPNHHNVYVVPLGVDRSIFNENVTPSPSIKPGPTVFLNCGKWEVRKGHDILLEAFDSAFTPDDNVLLLMNPHNPFIGEEGNKEWHDMYAGSEMGQAGKIRIVQERLGTQRHVASLMAAADVGVFPARAEGWNLEVLEMMSMGKPVITVNYSGNTEFCSEENSRLIDVDSMEDAYDGVWFHGQGQWAAMEQTQIDKLISEMIHLHRKTAACNHEFVSTNGIKTAQKFSWENSAQKLVEALNV